MSTFESWAGSLSGDGGSGLRPAMMALAQAQWLAGATADAPDWFPFLSSSIPSAGANPDTVYGVTPIDGRGTYRLSGIKGSVLFADVLIQSGIIGVAENPGPGVGVIDLTGLPADLDGRFEVLLSAERPAGCEGAWYRLDPRADHLWLRQVAYDWEHEIDYRVAIERVDVPVTPAPPVLATDGRSIGAFVERYTTRWRRHVERMAAKGLRNRLEIDVLPDTTGEVAQSYYQGLFDVPEGRALVLETPIPGRCRYWSVQLTDLCYTSLDWVHHQSSLNGFQAEVDADGRFRAVISAVDPGVANWLDTTGLQRGTLLGRWNHASDSPLPTLTCVELAQLGACLSPRTRRLTHAQRADRLRQRAKGAQLRRRW